MQAQAAGWALKLSQATASPPAEPVDWEALTRWLEGGRDRAGALDAAERALALVEANRLALRLRTDPRRPLARVWAGGGLVAAACVAVAVMLPKPAVPVQVWRAPADRPLEIVLSDNSRVTLNRTGVLTAAFRASEREVMLSPGSQATFEVTHKPARPFRIAVDGARVEVVGTRFDVDDGGGDLRVSVDRGIVNVGFDGSSQAWRLTPGWALEHSASGHVRLMHMAAVDVGSWRTGHLLYVDAPLAQVAHDLARYWGRPVAIDGAAAGLRFTGVLVVDTPWAMARRLALLAPVTVHDEGRSFTLEGRGGRT